VVRAPLPGVGGIAAFEYRLEAQARAGTATTMASSSSFDLVQRARRPPETEAGFPSRTKAPGSRRVLRCRPQRPTTRFQ